MAEYLKPNAIYLGDSQELLKCIEPNSISLSVWSPPYYVGKTYERDLKYEDWISLLKNVIELHYTILKPGAFLAINIADILCFQDENMPRIMAENVSRRKVPITKEQILEVWAKYPHYNRRQIAAILGCSEQTIQRRLEGNNVRGGKYTPQTRVKLVGGMLEDIAYKASLYLYDRRVWVKDPAWENSKWHTMSYRAVDEFEYIYIFWKPGITKINRDRLTKEEWINWGSRAVWHIPSVRSNNDHEAKFPVELPRRLIKLLTEPGEIVLDCFIGSGTTAVAAIMENRQYIGIDKMPEYVEMAKRACRIAMKEKLSNRIEQISVRDIQEL
jgi:site-specific DNA-methyltransferase (adenine-specific)